METRQREFDARYIEEFVSSSPLAALCPPSSPSPTSPSSASSLQQQAPLSPHHRRSSSAVQLRIKNRRTEPASRPHSWHSTKVGEGRQDLDQGAMDTVSSAWHHSYHASASTIDLTGGFDSSGGYLRKSPDQYSSRGSMESLDPPQSSQLHPGAQHHHPMGRHGHSGSHPTYSSCHQLSSARSSNSIDHLHNKRDSAYSSFSTSSSTPEYLASTPSFSPERSYSLETVPQRGGGSGDMQQADICYTPKVYETQQGLAQDNELNSTSHNSESRCGRGGRPTAGRDHPGSVGGVYYHGSSGSNNSGTAASNRHSVGSIWGPATSCSSYESLKGAPAPPRRSDSYAAIRNHERPNSWSSLEQARSLRSLQKGSWHHSSGPVASAKGSYGTEGQLHTVIEKSPESSPTTKPRQGGTFPQPLSPTGPSSNPIVSTPQSSRLIAPPGSYPVPQTEPQYAQMPTSNSNPGPSRVHPALAKDSGRQQLQGLPGVGGRDKVAKEVGRNGRTTAENGYPFSPFSATASTHLRTQSQEAERHQKEESNSGPVRTHIISTGSESDCQTEPQRPQKNKGPHSHSVQGSHMPLYTSQVPHSQVYQEQNHLFHPQQIHTASDFRPLSDAFIPAHSWGDRSRSMDQSSSHSEPVPYSRPAQGQMPPSHLPSYPQPQIKPFPTTNPASRHLSDSEALPYKHWDPREQDKDREHPLTRLENALAEVQQCTSSDTVDSASSHDSSNFSDNSKGPVRSLSVLEKVSRFERREHTGKQRSLSTSTSHHKATHLRMTEKGRSSPCGAEDLRHMLERSAKATTAQRTMSYRRGNSEQMKCRSPGDPSLALQRSRSSFHVSSEGDSSKDFPWTQEIQEMLGPIQDMPSNKSYRDTLKDAQSKVLRSTSFRRRDINSITSSPPPTAPPTGLSSSSQQPPPLAAKYHSLEKKGPKTKPKPVGVVLTPHTVPPVLSPHTPKERHVVCPDVRGPSPPALPSVPPVGPPALFRICGRKRLTVDQKKHSFSEPENMNEVGVSDAETLAFFRRGGETSVADRRKMFELVASRIGGGVLQSATSRPDLRQVQQDALVEYVERKRGVRRDEGGHRMGSRPRSALLVPDSNNSDTLSLSSASSLLSLQDCDLNFSSAEKRLCSILPSETGRVTTPRLPPHQPPSTPSGSNLDLRNHQKLTPEAAISGDSPIRHLSAGHEQQSVSSVVPSQQVNGALQRDGSGQHPGMSASAENLLEQPEKRNISPVHHHSRSSPTADRLNQDFVQGDIRMFGVFISEPGHCTLAADRPSDIHVSSHSPSQPSHSSLSAFQPVVAFQEAGSSQTPVPRRERSRTSDRQRAHSTSTLAASVGLPCPFSPPGPQDGSVAEWQASERLSLANLEAIMFPETGVGDGDRSLVTVSNDSKTRHSLSDASTLEDTVKDAHRARAFSLEMRRRRTEDNSRPVTPSTPAVQPHLQLSANGNNGGRSTSSPPPFPPSSIHLSSLRISESGLFDSIEQQQLMQLPTSSQQEDLDEVFLQNPSSLPAIRENVIREDFPPPPPPVVFQEAVEQQAVKSPSPELLNCSVIPGGNPSFLTSGLVASSTFEPSPVPPVSITSNTTEDLFSVQYQLLPKREKTCEEQRVEVLARQLVSQDPSLLPLLDTWKGKSTVEIMEDIFPNCKPSAKLQWDARIHDSLCDPAQTLVTDRGKETNLDVEDKSLNAQKVELCECLKSSIAALQQEKEALCEDQRRHQALGVSIETLVQENLKANEKDKYNMFIGDLDKIVNLLLSLCSRLSRIDKALLTLQKGELMAEDAAEERESLHHKHSLLLHQTEDARELKENLDRRQRAVHAILSNYLTPPQLIDYCHFVSTKPSFLIRQRQLDDLIQQGEEQLRRLVETLPTELAEAHGWATTHTFWGPTQYSSPFPPPLPLSAIAVFSNSARPTTVTSL